MAEVAESGHIRVNPDLNFKLKCLVEVTRRSVSKEGELAIESHLAANHVDVERGRKLLQQKARK